MFKHGLRYLRMEVPTTSLVVVDLSKDRLDGQIAGCVLQGIVNRQRDQKVYVSNTYCYDNKLSQRLDQAQVAESFLKELFCDIPAEWLPGNGDRDWPGFLALLDRFANLVKGLIIWDPMLEDATIEAATTIAGQTDGLVVSPELAEALSGRNLPVIADLRQHRFHNNLECLAWLLEDWFPGANKEIAFTWSHMTTNGQSWGAANKDYVVAHRLFTFYLDIFDEDERGHYNDVLRNYPPGTPVVGWSDERWADRLFESLGYFMVPYISVENLTVQASFPAIQGRQPAPRPLELAKNGVYIAFYIADGDNLLHALVYHPYTIMRSPAYGKLPITWVINPALIDLAPRLYQWYLDRLGSQELAAMMGDGVPGSDRSAGFKAFCDMTRDYLERSGILSLKVMGESEAAAWNIQPYVLNSGYAGPPDLRGIGHYEYHIDGNTFHIGNVNLTSDWRLFEIENLRKVIRQGPAGQPLFLNVFCGTCGGDIFSGPDQRDTPAMIQAVAESLQASEQADGKRYFFARSMDVAATYRKWQNLPV